MIYLFYYHNAIFISKYNCFRTISFVERNN